MAAPRRLADLHARRAAWYETAAAAADALLAGEQRGAYRTQLTRPTVTKGLFPVLWAPAATWEPAAARRARHHGLTASARARRRSVPCTASPLCRPPCHIHRPVTRHTLR